MKASRRRLRHLRATGRGEMAKASLAVNSLIRAGRARACESSNSSTEACSQSTGSCQRVCTSALSGTEMQISATSTERHTQAWVCAGMLQMLGREVRAHQSRSLAERVGHRREVQAVHHRALGLHTRLAPQDDALACAPASRELGTWVIGPTGAARVGRGGASTARGSRDFRGFRQGFLGFTLETTPSGENPMCGVCGHVCVTSACDV